jgi:hypothetical protein
MKQMEDNAALEEKQRKRKGKHVWDKRSKYTSNMNNGHKMQGWSEAGKVRFNALMTKVEDSRCHSTCGEIENDMLEKWRTMDGVGSRYTLVEKMKRMTRNEGRTAMKLSAGAAMVMYGLHDSTGGEMTGQLPI